MRKKGSYTIEAAILIPIYLLALGTILHIAFSLYGQIKEQREENTAATYWAVKDFYRLEGMEDWIEDE